MSDLELKTLKALYNYFDKTNDATYLQRFPEMEEEASLEIFKKLDLKGYILAQYLTEKEPCAANYRIRKITEKGLEVVEEELKKEKALGLTS